jgi:hypothetical protein
LHGCNHKAEVLGWLSVKLVQLGLMRRWRILALLLAIGFSAAVIHSIWGTRAAQKREIAYQLALATYTKQFRPATSRKNVEYDLQGNGIKFGQLCCVE